MSTFGECSCFILKSIRMSQVYQPVMLIEFLRNNGTATVEQIGRAILERDPTQVEYFSRIVKAMPGEILTQNRGITEKDGNTYTLNGAEKLSPEQRESHSSSRLSLRQVLMTGIAVTLVGLSRSSVCLKNKSPLHRTCSTSPLYRSGFSGTAYSDMVFRHSY